MWIVRLALRRPYTFVVMGVVIVLLGAFAIVTTPTDIFPAIVLSGLTGTERLVVNPPDGLKEGARVAGEEPSGAQSKPSTGGIS